MIALTHEALRAELERRGFQVYIADAHMVTGRLPSAAPHHARIVSFNRLLPIQGWMAVLLSERPAETFTGRFASPYVRDEQARVEDLTDVDQVVTWLEAVLAVELPPRRRIQINNFPTLSSR